MASHDDVFSHSSTERAMFVQDFLANLGIERSEFNVCHVRKLLFVYSAHSLVIFYTFRVNSSCVNRNMESYLLILSLSIQ